MRTTYAIGDGAPRTPRLTFDRSPRRWPWWVAGSAAVGLAAAGWLAAGRAPTEAPVPPSQAASAEVAVPRPATVPAEARTAPVAPVAVDRSPAASAAPPREPVAVAAAAPAPVDLGIPGLPPMAVLTPSADGLRLVGGGPTSLMVRMGLENGDTVLSIEGTQVQEGTDVARLLAPALTGRPLTAQVLRDGQTLPVPLVLRRPAEAAAAAATPP